MLESNHHSQIAINQKNKVKEVDSCTRDLSNQRVYLRAERAKVIIRGSNVPYRPMRDAEHAEARTFITIIAEQSISRIHLVASVAHFAFLRERSIF